MENFSIISISINLMLIGIIGVYSFQINRKLNRISEQQKGKLTKGQAHQFSSIYIDLILSKIHYKIELFFEDLEYKNGQTNEEKIAVFMSKVRTELRVTRQRTSDFYLENDSSYKDFIDGIDKTLRSMLDEGLQNGIKLFDQFKKNALKLEQFKDSVHIAVEQAGLRFKDVIKENLNILYG